MHSDHLERVRRVCLALPEASERLSHGEPTFFVRGKVFVMFANNHHGDGRVAVWLPAPPGFQEGLIETASATFFRPPYVGGRGWVGVVLEAIDDAGLRLQIETAWELVAPKRLRLARQAAQADQTDDVRVEPDAAAGAAIRQLPSGPDSLAMQAFLSGLTPADAFRALVEPALLVRWWPPEAEVDAHEGGAYCMRWPQQGWQLRGRFLALAPPERLDFTWRWDHEPELPERTVRIVIAPHGPGSLLTLFHGSYDRSARDQADRQSHHDGWQHFLARLQELVV
jgi:uncharacterized protein YndB with AHSA1/START domain